jgi:putative oxidoreductase
VPMINVAFLVLRVVVGLLFAGHGTQKLFGWWGGHGLAAMSQWLTSLGVRPARFWALVAGLCETVGGLLFAFGFLTPFAALALIGVMFVAIATVHWTKGIWAAQGGFEYNLVLIAAALATGLAGPGDYALDHAFGIVWPEPRTMLIGLVVVALAQIVALYLAPRAAGAWHWHLPGKGQIRHAS